MNRLIYTVLPLLLITLVQCTGETQHNLRDEADRLYAETAKLTRAYTDSLNNVIDSASITRLVNDYEDKLQRINHTYPPLTDTYIEEGQNDTLYMLQQKYLAALENARHPKVVADTVSIDSVQ